MSRSILPSGIRTNNTVVRDPSPGITECILHRTTIASWNRVDGTVTLDTGGYDTPTTIRRMNECLHHWGFNARVCKADFRNANVVRIASNQA